jgi:ubiquinone/menaquinone biosynthesis C-methylase UbiE
MAVPVRGESAHTRIAESCSVPPMSDPLEFGDREAEYLEVFYRSADILRRRRLVAQAVSAQPGERLLDVGCGPGFYVAEMAPLVGDSGNVTGVDPSREMLAAAARRTADQPNVTLLEGEALDLPVPSDAFDTAYSVQVLEYVPDTEAALRELHRVLRPGGRLVVWDVDWETVSWHSADPDRMQRVLHAWDDHLSHPALPQTLAAAMTRSGFEDVRAEGHAFVNTDAGIDGDSSGVMRFVENFVPGPRGVTQAETDEWRAELDALSEAGRYFFTCIQVCFTATRP